MKEDKLQGKERIIVYVSTLLTSGMAGAWFYYLWRKQYPSKAKEAKKISWVVFLVGFIAYSAYRIVTD